MATNRLVSCCDRFHSVSKRHETVNTLISLENLLPVSLFHHFRDWPTGNLISRFRWFLPLFKSRRPFPKNHETAKQQPIPEVNTITYLFHPALKQPATVSNRQRHKTARLGCLPVISGA
jgi:hypothetical protein